jgi:hypothetical protein
MKTIKIINFFLIGLLLLPQFNLYGGINSEPPSKKELKKYLKHNQYNIKYDSNDFQFLNDKIHNYSVYFIGETHGFAETRKFAIHYMKYLKEKTNFKYYLDEVPYSMGLKLNEYLKTGDETHLIKAINNVKGSIGWTKESANVYRAIYEINKNYSEKDRIKVLAVDIEHIWIDTKETLLSLFKKLEIDSNEKVFNMINNANKFDSLIIACREFVKSDQSYNKSILTNYYEDVYHICQNFIYLGECKKSNNWDDNRDERIFLNFEKFVKQLGLQNEKFFGIWGEGHTYQKESDSTRWLASRIIQSSLKMNVLTFSSQYYRCKVLAKSHEILGVPKLFRLFKSERKLKKSLYTHSLLYNSFWSGALWNIKLLTSQTKRKSVTVFDIQKEDSPFFKTDMFSQMTDQKKKEYTAEYFQYIVFFRNSKAQSPFGPNVGVLIGDN